MIIMLVSDFKNNDELSRLLESLISLDEVDDYPNPPITIHFKNPNNIGEWWICAGKQLPNDDALLFGVCEIFEREMGFVSLSQIREIGGCFDTDYDGELKLYDLL